jgi:hypothetical protein
LENEQSPTEKWVKIGYINMFYKGRNMDNKYNILIDTQRKISLHETIITQSNIKGFLKLLIFRFSKHMMKWTHAASGKQFGNLYWKPYSSYPLMQKSPSRITPKEIMTCIYKGLETNVFILVLFNKRKTFAIRLGLGRVCISE